MPPVVQSAKQKIYKQKFYLHAKVDIETECVILANKGLFQRPRAASQLAKGGF